MARQRNYRAEYERRLQRAKGLTPRQATHRQGGYAPAFLAGFDQVVTVKVSLATAKRIGRYDNLVNQLVRGRISERQFDRTTARWQPVQVQSGSEIPEGKYRFADAATALYMAEAASALPDERTIDFDIQGS